MEGSSGGTKLFLHGPGLLIVSLGLLQRSDFYDIDINNKDKSIKRRHRWRYRIHGDVDSLAGSELGAVSGSVLALDE